ncbi:MAG: glycosyltransferase family 9 protein [Ignavibacteria bacterium]
MTIKVSSSIGNSLTISEVRNILVVKQHNQLGDMLCTYPLLAALKKKFPTAKLTLVASPENSGIINPNTDNYVDYLITYNKYSIGKVIKFVRRLLKHRYDIGIVPSTVSFSRTSHLINFLAGSKIRVGVLEIDGEKNPSSKYLNVAGKFEWEGQKLHQTEKMIEIVQQIGCSLTKDEISNLELQLSPEEITFAKTFINANFPDRTTPIFAFFCGAGKSANRWKIENFKQLILMLHKKYKQQILIILGNTDIELTRELFYKVESVFDGVVKLQRENIREVAAVLKYCDLFVSNDTGIMHVAAFVNTAVVGLFGPTKGYEWGPVNKRGTFIQSPTEDINDLTPDIVYKFIVNFLEQKR